MEKRLETALSIYDKTIYHTGAVSPADLISRLSFLLKIRPFFVLLFFYFLIYALTAGENKCCVPEEKKRNCAAVSLCVLSEAVCCCSTTTMKLFELYCSAVAVHRTFYSFPALF